MSFLWDIGKQCRPRSEQGLHCFLQTVEAWIGGLPVSYIPGSKQERDPSYIPLSKLENIPLIKFPNYPVSLEVNKNIPEITNKK